MANPTTNFGWVMPTSSSLVTNLPADFNTFGQGVDTSMAQLKGGTTGQILSKTSATDMAFTWITNDVGDITAVTAVTGISGGGTSGAVTITNSMATEITAKGDLIAGTGSATFDNLPVGTNGQTLVADSTASTGLKWATASSGAIKQVVTVTYATAVSTNGTETDTGLTASITPSSSGSKIIAIVSIPRAYFAVSTTATSADATFTLYRGATEISRDDFGGYLSVSGGAGKEIYVPQTFMTVDSPSTTSSTTYKVTVKTGQSTTTAYTSASAAGGTISMTLMEI